MFNDKFLEKLSRIVEELEAVSSVELVVVAGPVSGNYRDIDRQNGFFAAVIMLLVAVYSPWDFAPELLLLWLVAAYMIGMLVTPKLSGLRRLFSNRARRMNQVRVCARNYFWEKRISYTRERTGLLLYLSHFERLGLLLPDAGLEAKVPHAVFNELEFEWSKCRSVVELESAVLQGLEKLKAPLAKALPRPEDDENELPNEICIVSGEAL